jgi:hypothetical protein
MGNYKYMHSNTNIIIQYLHNSELPNQQRRGTGVDLWERLEPLRFPHTLPPMLEPVLSMDVLSPMKRHFNFRLNSAHRPLPIECRIDSPHRCVEITRADRATIV